MWATIGKKDSGRQFLPATGVAYLAIVFAAGLQFDLLAVIVAIVFVPATAYAINLLFRPLIWAIANPEREASKMADGMVKAISRPAKLNKIRRQGLRDTLVQWYRPLVRMQFDEFWATRDRDADLDENLRRHEVRMISVGFLGFVLLLSAFLSWIEMASLPQPPSAPPPLEFWAGLALIILSFIFVASFQTEFQSYHRVLQTRIPLLMAVNTSFDSGFWIAREEFIEARRQTLGEELASRMTAAARRKRDLALSGELEREWIENRVSQEGGLNLDQARALIEALASLQEESKTSATSVYLFMAASISVAATVSWIIIGLLDSTTVAVVFLLLLLGILPFFVLLLAIPFISRYLRTRKMFREIRSRLSRD